MSEKTPTPGERANLAASNIIDVLQQNEYLDWDEARRICNDAIREAVNDAVERVAKLSDRHELGYLYCDQLPAAIRALKEKP